MSLQVLFAFMVGLHNLYWYYGSHAYEELVDEPKETRKLVHSSEAFQGYDYCKGFTRYSYAIGGSGILLRSMNDTLTYKTLQPQAHTVSFTVWTDINANTPA